MVDVKNVSYKYKNGEIVLEDINLEVKTNETVCIIGKNGSGKSSLARLIAGITVPTKGDIFISGINTKDKSKFIELRKTIRNSFSEPRKPNYI